MTAIEILTGSLIVLLVLLLFRLLYKFDLRKEQRRQRCAIASRMLRETEPQMSQLLRCYAAGDYAGLMELLTQAADTVHEARPAEAEAEAAAEELGYAIEPSHRSRLQRRD